MDQEKFRLLTRSDMDGLVCAVLLRELGLIDEISFVHPKDMQDGVVEITETDITTNLPYVDGVYLAFDHHYSETIRNEEITRRSSRTTSSTPLPLPRPGSSTTTTAPTRGCQTSHTR